MCLLVLRCCSDGKASACNAGDLGLIPGLGRSPGEGNGSTLQYSCLENPMDRRAWWATVIAECFDFDYTCLTGMWLTLGLDPRYFSLRKHSANGMGS